MIPDMAWQDAKAAAATGGGFAGAFYAVRWFVLWLSERVDRREAQVEADRDELDTGWKAYRIVLERRMAAYERQNNALRVAFQHVSVELIRLDPQNEGLRRAERVMAEAYPTDFSMAAAMAEAALDKREARA